MKLIPDMKSPTETPKGTTMVIASAVSMAGRLYVSHVFLRRCAFLSVGMKGRSKSETRVVVEVEIEAMHASIRASLSEALHHYLLVEISHISSVA